MAIQAIDSYDTLFAKCENIAAPTTFLDSSTANPKTLTANGNAKQLPVKFNKSAGFFNGTTDFLTVPSHTDFNFGTGNFDLECFVFFSSISGDQVFIQRNSSTDFWLARRGGNLELQTGGVARCSAAWTPNLNQWYHLRATRSGTGSNQTVVYVDAVQHSIGTSADNITSSAIVTIGGISGSYYLNGWMKEVRISNTNRANAVPTVAYTSDSNTKLLMHFDTPADSPIGPAIYFDGAGDNIKFPNGGDFDIGSGDFCVEGFYETPPTGTADTAMAFWDSGVDASKGIAVLVAPMASDYVYVYLNGSLKLSATTCGFKNSTKYHITAERYSGNLKVFVNGRQIATVADSTAVTANSAVSPRIGTRIDDSTSPLKGYIREFRFSNVNRYAGTAFTPTQLGFTVDSNTKLYVKGNEANGTTTFVDSGNIVKTITTTGDTKIKWTEDYRSCIFLDSETTPKYPYPVGSAKVDFFAIGTGVGYFDGTNSYLEIPDSNDFDWAAPSGTTNDFTYECYVRYNALDASATLFARETINVNRFHMGSDGTYEWNLTNATTIISGTNGLSNINMWRHYALVRTGTTINLFENGTLIKTGTDNTDHSSAEKVRIGFNYIWYSNFRLDNIRIAKGVARYTAAFNPPFEVSSSGAGVSATSTFFMIF